MFPIIEIGPLALQAAGFILLISFWLSTWITGRFSSALGTNGEVIENSFLLGLLIGIVGARVGFLLQNLEVLSSNPLSFFSLTPSMLNPSFGILVGVLVVFILNQKNHLPLWPTLDTLPPFLLVLFIGLQIANLANGEAYGLPTQVSWGITLWGASRHPVQAYSLLLTLILLIWFIVKTKTLKSTGFLQNGLLFSFTLGGLSLITIFTRSFIAEKILVGGVDLLQLISLLILIGCLLIIYYKYYQTDQEAPVVISMGSNQHPNYIIDALARLKSEFNIIRTSSLYETQNVKKDSNSSKFINQVIEITTKLPYSQLREKLKSIEQQFGRAPGDKKVVPLDLDILTFKKQVFEVRGVHIPDPNLIKYRYIAEPIAEMDPNFRHPGNGKSIQSILQSITDHSKIQLWNKVENGIKE
jgi:2-amino-4-hydroxy-6-hydroxymethyldihydropteridine diphosphokinase